MREAGDPTHVAIIMDGNARWAKARGLKNAAEGYEQGVETAISIVKASVKAGISYLTLFLFSTENWGRDPEDIRLVFNLFEKTSIARLDEFHSAGIKIKVIGERQGLSRNVEQVIKLLEDKTERNSGMQLCLAMNYGGKSEIVSAVSRIIADGVSATEINAEKFSSYLYTKSIPDPDLIIRTAGEKRLSNFFLWQSSYSELYFCDTLWPEFTERDLVLALETYRMRHRKYGK